jgi:hypothetical protein
MFSVRHGAGGHRACARARSLRHGQGLREKRGAQSTAARRVLRPARAQVLGLRSLKPYTPDFKTAFEHFCIHPGGKTVIEGVGSQARWAPCASPALAVYASASARRPAAGR